MSRTISLLSRGPNFSVLFLTVGSPFCPGSTLKYSEVCIVHSCASPTSPSTSFFAVIQLSECFAGSGADLVDLVDLID